MVDKSTVVALQNRGADYGIEYLWDSKPAFTAPLHTIKNSDCSGWVRYVLYQASAHFADNPLPEGSVEIHEVIRRLFASSWCHYKDAGKKDGKLRIAFIAPGKEHSGHVWLILNGQTIECHGSKIGVNSRKWNTPVLLSECEACYVLPT